MAPPLQVTKTVFTVSDFLSWQKGESLVLNPHFQRRQVWKKGAKSFLIDTVARGLPMPIVFLREQKTDLKTLKAKRDVIDGQQRLRTLISFIDPHSLPNYDPDRDDFHVLPEHNEDLAGKSFAELGPEQRQRILGYEISVHILPSSVGDREVLQIFRRMNSTGVKLNAQELRNAEFFGEFKTSMYNLAEEQLERWRAWEVFDDDDISRMAEVEFVSDFAQLALAGISGKSVSGLNKLYAKYDKEFPARKEIERRFHNVMDRIDDVLGPTLKDTVFVKKPAFYALSALIYDLIYGLESPLKSAKPKSTPSGLKSGLLLASAKISEGKAPEKVQKGLRGATAHKQTRQSVFDYLKQVTSTA